MKYVILIIGASSGFGALTARRLAEAGHTAVPDADVAEVADAIVKVVDMPFGQRPFRVHVDPANDGAEVVNGVADRVRAELLRNMGLGDLLRPSSTPNNFQIKVGRTADAPRV
jgi:NAD(P)-dependent dehydrogenase (short-subunit alcohol dehydrogenase family)